MSVTDLIADQITVIRNAINAGKKTVIIRRSNTLEEIIEIIKKEGFIEDYKVMEDNKQGKIKVYLKYRDKTCAISAFERISKPGRREYVPVKGITRVKGGVGLSILSTCKGLLTDTEAKEQGVGGELICRVW